MEGFFPNGLSSINACWLAIAVFSTCRMQFVISM